MQRLNVIRRSRKTFIDPLAGLDVETEFELIKQKQSLLPAVLRKLIINECENQKREL